MQISTGMLLDAMSSDKIKKDAAMESLSVALGIPRARHDTQTQGRQIALVGIEQELRKLGRFPESQRQQTVGQGIKRAGMAGLAGLEQPFGARYRLLGSQGLLHVPSGPLKSLSAC